MTVFHVAAVCPWLKSNLCWSSGKLHIRLFTTSIRSCSTWYNPSLKSPLHSCNQQQPARLNTCFGKVTRSERCVLGVSVQQCARLFITSEARSITKLDVQQCARLLFQASVISNSTKLRSASDSVGISCHSLTTDSFLQNHFCVIIGFSLWHTPACQRCEFNSLEFDQVLLSFGWRYQLCSPQVFGHAGVCSLKWSSTFVFDLVVVVVSMSWITSVSLHSNLSHSVAYKALNILWSTGAGVKGNFAGSFFWRCYRAAGVQISSPFSDKTHTHCSIFIRYQM